MILTAEDIEAVAVRAAELVAAEVVAKFSKAAPREVMSAREAALFVGKPGRDAFRDWRAKFGVRPCGHGRYSLRSLKAALEREGRKSYQHVKSATLDQRAVELSS